MSDYYSLLGLTSEASVDEVKSAYRREVRRHHPDTGGNAEVFKQLGDAYRVLSDPVQRAVYDERMHSTSSGTGSTPRGEEAGTVLEIKVSLEDVLFGAERWIEIDHARMCGACGGSGGRPGQETSPCGSCSGQGKVEHVVRTPHGQLAGEDICRRCQGTGMDLRRLCPSCHGGGRQIDRWKLAVEVPPGVVNRSRRSLFWKDPSIGGDLRSAVVEIEVAKHDVFRRNGRNLYADLPLSRGLATVGGAWDIQLLDGTKERIGIPVNAKDGDVVTLPAAGLPPEGGGPLGDLQLTIKVQGHKELDGRRNNHNPPLPRAKSLLNSLGRQARLNVRNIGRRWPLTVSGRGRKARGFIAVEDAYPLVSAREGLTGGTEMIERLGHTGVWVNDLKKMEDFYSRVLGLRVTDRDDDLGIVFLSSRPEVEHHEFVLQVGRRGDDDAKILNQISWRIATLDDLLELHRRFVAEGVVIQQEVSHGNAIGIYFFDPEGNRNEVYWPTGLEVRQPFRKSINLDQSQEAVLAEVERLLDDDSPAYQPADAPDRNMGGATG